MADSTRKVGEGDTKTEANTALAALVSSSRDDGLIETESLCMRCERNGTTRILCTLIPYFREVILMSFECPHCGFRNNEIQPGSSLQDQGVRLTLSVRGVRDVNRQVIKSEHATILIPSLEFEIPSGTQRGISSTVQGMLMQAADALSELQPQRKLVDDVVAAKIDRVIDSLRKMADGETEYIFVLDDPSGNSYIESECAPDPDPQIRMEAYERTTQQLNAMGFYAEQKDTETETETHTTEADTHQPEAATGPTGPTGATTLPMSFRAPAHWDLTSNLEASVAGGDGDGDGEGFVIDCPHCGQKGKERLCEIDIPGFRKCIVMAFDCPNCGCRSNELKPGGEIGEQGRKFVLTVETLQDLNRDVLKSDTSYIEIPSMDLSMQAGTLGGLFTTVEGLLLKLAESLEQSHPFVGDSTTNDKKSAFLRVTQQLRSLAAGDGLPFQLFLVDPANRSFIGARRDGRAYVDGQLQQLQQQHASPQDAGDGDAQLQSILYTRTAEEDDDLGITDMVLS